MPQKGAKPATNSLPGASESILIWPGIKIGPRRQGVIKRKGAKAQRGTAATKDELAARERIDRKEKTA